ncbi:MAG: hypothetical protein ACJZ7Z_05080 [Myxococcota bacterium]|nr:hypothetical protein [Spirochaeta sp.]RPG12185.1 MAG: hypothetical protein CBC32_003950 [Proteobacteria bacterium TMED72]
MYGNENKTKAKPRLRRRLDSWASATLLGLGFLAVVLVTGFVHQRIPVAPESEQSGRLVPRPEVAQVLSLGFESVVSDYYWLKAVQIAGGARTPGPEQGDYLARLVDLVTYLNPHVGHAYRFAAVWLIQTEEEVREANRLLRRGIESQPEEWRNWFYLGFNHFYYLDETEEAARNLAVASELPGAPAYLSRLVVRLRAESGGLDVAQALLSEMVRDTQTEEALSGYLEALGEIEVERHARDLDSAREAFVETYGRDIESMDELAAFFDPILNRLPRAQPSRVGIELGGESNWVIDPESNQIVSDYYGRRYRVNFASDRAHRIEEWNRSAGTVSESSSEEGAS